MDNVIKSRLAGWKACKLSLAGSITLAKSMIEALPLYPMMTSVIPKTCLIKFKKHKETSSRGAVLLGVSIIQSLGIM